MEIIANESFSFAKKGEMDSLNPAVKAWETLMSNYQKLIPGTPEGTKWVLAKNIFSLTS
jgi:L-rhamnose mutarotase